jgi:hypothetical protein
MATKKEAGALAKQPACKSFTAILSRLLPRRKRCRCAPELWSTCADMLSVTAQVQTDLARYQAALDSALTRLVALEAVLWHFREGADDE